MSPNLVRRSYTILQGWSYGPGVVCSCLQKQTGLQRPPSEEQRGLLVHPAGISAPEPGSEMGNTGEHLVYKQMSIYRPDGAGPANEHKQNESVKVVKSSIASTSIWNNLYNLSVTLIWLI